MVQHGWPLCARTYLFTWPNRRRNEWNEWMSSGCRCSIKLVIMSDGETAIIQIDKYRKRNLLFKRTSWFFVVRQFYCIVFVYYKLNYKCEIRRLVCTHQKGLSHLPTSRVVTKHGIHVNWPLYRIEIKLKNFQLAFGRFYGERCGSKTFETLVDLSIWLCILFFM